MGSEPFGKPGAARGKRMEDLGKKSVSCSGGRKIRNTQFWMSNRLFQDTGNPSENKRSNTYECLHE